jgi:hypothetical protein
MSVCLYSCLSCPACKSRFSSNVPSCAACLALPYISTLFHKRHHFRNKTYWTQTVCFDFVYNFV